MSLQKDSLAGPTHILLYLKCLPAFAWWTPSGSVKSFFFLLGRNNFIIWGGMGAERLGGGGAVSDRAVVVWQETRHSKWQGTHSSFSVPYSFKAVQDVSRFLWNKLFQGFSGSYIKELFHVRP